MNDEDLRKRNHQMLRQVHPWHRDGFACLMQNIQDYGYRIRINEGGAWRRRGIQENLASTGVSQVKVGLHNVTWKGKPASLAVDLLNDDEPMREDARLYTIIAIEAHRLGFETGVLWGLPQELRPMRQQAIELGDVQRLATLLHKRGWDPLHVQPINGGTMVWTLKTVSYPDYDHIAHLDKRARRNWWVV